MKDSQNKQPLVSVIIPNYNHAKYLDQRIQTVLGQTYQNFEVIILDDCSTDNSLEVIEKYKKNSHVSQIVVNEKNSGNTFLQWDKGIHLAQGDLIWVAESDDYCELNFLDELVKAYNRDEHTVLAYSTLTLVDESGNVTYRPKCFENQSFSAHQYLRKYLSLANFIRNASCAVFSRAAALNVPKDYMNYSGAGDYLFWVMVAAQGRVAIVNKGISYFRRHSGVVTEKRDADGSNFIAEKEIWDKLSSIVHVSQIRKEYVYAYHCRRVRSVNYDSEQIRNNLLSLWQVSEHSSIVSKVILKITDFARRRYNCYL